MASNYRFTFLGALTLSIQDEPEEGWIALDKPVTAKAQSLLAYLAINRQRPIRRERLAAMFWGDRPDRKARQSLATALWHIRQIFTDKTLIQSDSQTIQFDPHANITLDIFTFDTLCASNRPADWQTAVNLYLGDFLENYYDDWIINTRYVYQERYYKLLAQLMVAYEEESAWQMAATTANRLLGYEPLREDAHQLLMKVYSRLGKTDKALRQYRRCREALLTELAVEPMAETTALYQAILQNRLGKSQADEMTGITTSAQAIPMPGESPFKGLQFFDVSDADLFFGRDALVTQLVAQVLESPFLAIVGASGSGKSSVVRAGLIPLLHQKHQIPYHLITPTKHPMQALTSWQNNSETAVSKEAENTPIKLLVIDQFEELFTICRNEKERAQFVSQLVTAVTQPHSTWKTIIVLRADFYSHCAEYEGLRTLVAQHQAFIGPMNTDELRQTIIEPIRQNGWEIAPGLVDLIVRDMGEEPGALPLLSHAMLETWRRRQGRLLTLAGYTDTGGVFGAIAKTADAVFNALLPEQQHLAKSIFLRLTELGEGAQDTRRRVKFDELPLPQGGQNDVNVVLKQLTDARLIVTTTDAAEVAHEALIREWPALRQWLNKNRESLRIHRQLTDAAQAWARLERDEGALYRGALLQEAQEWFDARLMQLNSLESDFLHASIKLADRQIANEEAQRQRELAAAQQLALTRTESARRLRQRAWGLMVLTAVAFIFALWALISRQQTAEQQQIATSRELAAAALNQLTVDPELSTLLALEAIKLSNTTESINALHQTLPALSLIRTLSGHSLMIQSVAFHPDGTKVATAGMDRSVRIWSAQTGNSLLILPDSHETSLIRVAFHPDGKHLVTSGLWDRQIKVWQLLQTDDGNLIGELVDSINTGKSGPLSLAISPDGSWLAAGLDDGSIKLWQFAMREETSHLKGHAPMPSTTIVNILGVTDIAFHPNGAYLASAGTDGQIHLWDVNHGETVFTHQEERAVMSLDFSPDGTKLAAISENNTMKVWHLESQTLMPTMELNVTVEGNNVVFSPDGRFLATASGTGTSTLWEAQTGNRVKQFYGHTGAVRDVQFNPDGSQIATASEDGTIKIWDLTPGREWLTLSDVAGFAFTPDDRYLVTAHYDSALSLWNRESGRIDQQLTGIEFPIKGMTFSTDGALLATTSVANAVTVWSFPALEPIFQIPAQSSPVWHVQFSPNAALLAISNEIGEVHLWDIKAEKMLHKWLVTQDGAQASQVHFHPKGTQLATIGWDGRVTLLDVASREVLAEIQLDDGGLDVAFSPDGLHLAVADRSGVVSIWSTAALDREPVLVLQGHSSAVTGVIYVGNGRQLATVSFDGSVRLWDLENGREQLKIDTPDRLTVFLDASPDGTHLVTGTLEGTMRGYLLEQDALIALAQERITRTLTDEECRRFLHVEQCPSKR